MVANTTKPLSHLTRNIAFGSVSWTTPSNSSLSPFGSFLSRRSLMQLQTPKISVRSGRCCERFENSIRDLVDSTHSVDPLQNAFCLVVGQKLSGHFLVRV